MTTSTSLEPRIILPDTSLCAIVRDEIMNPAGGIVDFVDSTLPYVEAGVIVDTGSKDGTRKALEDLKEKYSHLEVYDAEFRGFAHARNESLKHCRTKRALCLDADERLTVADFETIKNILTSENISCYYSFHFLNIVEDFTPDKGGCSSGWNPRLFEIEEVNFVGEVWELFSGNRVSNYIGVQIKHFRAPAELRAKKFEFYQQFNVKRDILNAKPLRDFSFFQELKKYNPKREEYR